MIAQQSQMLRGVTLVLGIACLLLGLVGLYDLLVDPPARILPLLFLSGLLVTFAPAVITAGVLLLAGAVGALSTSSAQPKRNTPVYLLAAGGILLCIGAIGGLWRELEFLGFMLLIFAGQPGLLLTLVGGVLWQVQRKAR